MIVYDCLQMMANVRLSFCNQNINIFQKQYKHFLNKVIFTSNYEQKFD